MPNAECDPVRILAEYLTGPDVASNSIALGLPHGWRQRQQAERYFALRAAFGISGYASAKEAEAAIRAALK